MLLNAHSMQVSVSRLMFDPEFYPFAWHPADACTEFLIVDEDLLDRAPFVDQRIASHARGQFSVDTAQLLELAGQLPPARLSFVFHTAFCCSTLLARSLAACEAFFALKEPQLLRCLSDLRHREGPPVNDWAPLLTAHLRLLARPYAGGGHVVIKASNVANNLLPDVLRHLPRSRVVLLHGPLEDFLVSCLKKPESTQAKIPALLERVTGYGDFLARFPQFADTRRFEFLQQCALLWLVQHHDALAHARSAAERVLPLDFRSLLDHPRETLQEVGRFLGHEPDSRDLLAMTGANVMGRHAKDLNLPFDAATRREENAAVQRTHRNAIHTTRDWLAPVVDASGIGSGFERLSQNIATRTRRVS